MKRTTRGSAAGRDQRRKHRSRPTPTWLLEQQDLDEIARRRCLMVLSVLSGETPVSDAIVEAQISRGTYYHLEERALRAMLEALKPGAEAKSEPSELPAQRRVAELEAKLSQLEKEKRRSERLLLLTRKMVKAGPMKTGAGRPRRVRDPASSSVGAGSAPSRSSKPRGRPKATPSSIELEEAGTEASIPTPAGADER